MHVDEAIFRARFAQFSDWVKQESGKSFVSFRLGLPYQWEGYKDRVRDVGLRRLEVESWDLAEIGSGRLIECLISAIEIGESALRLRNNLLMWDGRHGDDARVHAGLYDARDNPEALQAVEEWLYGFFRDELPVDAAFEQLRKLIGNRYSLVAYVFFLKDWTRFMPIAPISFDKAFEFLGLRIVTAHHCSWENYIQYNDGLRAVQRALVDIAHLEDTRLIDAHSFCWMLTRPDSEKGPNGARPA